MKKSLLNIAVSVAIASVLLSASALSTQVYASEYIPDDNDSSNDKTTETYMLPGMGAGAATGVVIAGPAGLLIGGLIGALVGSSQPVSEQEDSLTVAEVEVENSIPVATISNDSDQLTIVDDSDTEKSIQLAQIGPINTVIENQSDPAEEKLMNILVTDLSLDVYFRSGSTEIEKFYPARLSAIANLINSMDKLELHLDGYTDRRGDKSQNIALANERVEKVRQQLIDAGVADNRIVSKAFGEIKMVSAAGDLDAYTFDRKVVIRFERADQNSMYSMTTALSAIESASEAEQLTSADTETSLSPVVADTSTQF